MNTTNRRALERLTQIQQAGRNRRLPRLSHEVQQAKLRHEAACVIPVESCREKPGISGNQPPAVIEIGA